MSRIACLFGSSFINTNKNKALLASGRFLAVDALDRLTVARNFWQSHAQDGLNAQQTKVLNRLLDDGPEGFEGGLSAANYKGLAKVSKATATRHLQELLDKGCIVKLAGGGRSMRYDINWPE